MHYTMLLARVGLVRSERYAQRKVDTLYHATHAQRCAATGLNKHRIAPIEACTHSTPSLGSKCMDRPRKTFPHSARTSASRPVLWGLAMMDVNVSGELLELPWLGIMVGTDSAV